MATLGTIISEDEVQRTPRGRKAVYDQELVELLSTLTPGNAARLDGLQETDKDKRSAVSAHIRKHFAAAQGDDVKCRVEYTSEGVPQVRFTD
jgi:hypothetical protein